MRIAHTSDAHIDHITNAATGALRRHATRENADALASVVDGALEREVDVFLHAGDAFAHGRPSPEALLLFAETLRPLQDAGIPIVLSGGNHEELRHRAGQRTATAVLGEMLATYGEVHVVDQEPTLLRTSNGLQVACLPWLDAARILHENNQLGLPEEDANAFVADQIGHLFEQLLADADDTAPLIGMSHLAVSSARRGSEKDLTALFREPVVNAARLSELSSAYMALGHIHTPQKLDEGVYYAGSPQKFTFTDEPDRKGWNMVTITDHNELASVKRVFTRTRQMVTFDLAHDPEPEVDLDEHTLVRVRLAEGETSIPGALAAAVEGAGARIVSRVLRRPETNPTEEELTGRVLAETATDDEALTAWLEANRPEQPAGEVVGLAHAIATGTDPGGREIGEAAA